MVDQTRPEEETEDAEEEDARAAHEADREPTPEEEEAAEQNELDPEVAANYKEALETGAQVKGEGAPEPDRGASGT